MAAFNNGRMPLQEVVVEPTVSRAWFRDATPYLKIEYAIVLYFPSEICIFISRNSMVSPTL